MAICWENIIRICWFLKNKKNYEILGIKCNENEEWVKKTTIRSKSKKQQKGYMYNGSSTNHENPSPGIGVKQIEWVIFHSKIYRHAHFQKNIQKYVNRKNTIMNSEKFIKNINASTKSTLLLVRLNWYSTIDWAIFS